MHSARRGSPVRQQWSPDCKSALRRLSGCDRLRVFPRVSGGHPSQRSHQRSRRRSAGPERDDRDHGTRRSHADPVSIIAWILLTITELAAPKVGQAACVAVATGVRSLRGGVHERLLSETLNLLPLVLVATLYAIRDFRLNVGLARSEIRDLPFRCRPVAATSPIRIGEHPHRPSGREIHLCRHCSLSTAICSVSNAWYSVAARIWPPRL